MVKYTIQLVNIGKWTTHNQIRVRNLALWNTTLWRNLFQKTIVASQILFWRDVICILFVICVFMLTSRVVRALIYRRQIMTYKWTHKNTIHYQSTHSSWWIVGHNRNVQLPTFGFALLLSWTSICNINADQDSILTRGDRSMILRGLD
jgi:hypothetical protein